MGRGDDYVFDAGDIFGHNIFVATLPASQEYSTVSAAILSRIPLRDIRLGGIFVALPEGDRAGLGACKLEKETTEDGFQLLRLGYVLTTTETAIRSVIAELSYTPWVTYRGKPLTDGVWGPEM
ncbi:hypothetical protein PG985_008742 [Apiospora marii]|uniref:uncharacterized protein n=1 Tax=Apiospora marii TaxID=335849 RepID=UPI003131AF72